VENRNLIAIVLILVVVGGGVVGFMLLSTPPVTEEDVIIFGTTDSVEASIDPAQSYDYFGWEIITSLGSGLVEIIPGTSASADDIRGALAESWTVNAAGDEWTFILREGLTFEDGTAFDADVVKYSFDRNIDMALEDGPQLNMGYGDIIAEVVVVDDYEVRFDLNFAFAPFLQLMSCAASYIVHPDYAPLENYVPYNASVSVRERHPNGLGPYILQNWTRTGGSDTEMRLVKNENYWADDLPANDMIIIKFYQTDAALTAAMADEEIDVAYRHMTPTQVDSFRDDDDFIVWDGVGASIQYMCFQQDIYPYSETPIRQGIAAALNRTNLAETVFVGTVDPLYSIVPAGMAYHKPSFEVYGQANYTYTQTMLAMYGYNETNKLEIDLWYESSGHYPSSLQQAQLYKSDLDASGVITVTLHGVEWATFRLNRNAGTMPVFIYGWYPDFIDPDNYGFLPFASWLNMGYNETYPAGGIAQYALWVAGRSAASSAARQTAYYALQDLQAVECSIIPLWQGKSVAVSTDSVGGIVLDITVNWRHWLLTIT
jgi:peptide/nickel transport system substrate-binding protein